MVHREIEETIVDLFDLIDSRNNYWNQFWNKLWRKKKNDSPRSVDRFVFAILYLEIDTKNAAILLLSIGFARP